MDLKTASNFLSEMTVKFRSLLVLPLPNIMKNE